MSKYVKVDDVMSLVNTSNRGTCDYFIVDQIENLCESNKVYDIDLDRFLQRLEQEMPHDICDGEEALEMIRRVAAEMKNESITQSLQEQEQPAPVADPAPVQTPPTRSFTGYFDSNGKRIRLGDKVNVNGLIGTVGFDEAAGMYKLVEYAGYYITDADTDWEVLPDDAQTNAPDFQKFFEKFKKKMDDVFYLDSETTLLDLGDTPDKQGMFILHCPDGYSQTYCLGALYDEYARMKAAGVNKPIKSLVNDIETACDAHDMEANEEDREWDYEPF